MMSTSQSKELATASPMAGLPPQLAVDSAPNVYERVRIPSPSIYGADRPGEIWKGIAGLEDRFEVSNLGRIRSLARHFYGQNFGVGRPALGKILKLTVCPKGCERVVVLSQGKAISLRVNRVVAIAFIPNPTNLPYVRHKNNNKLNNRVDNLEWTAKRQKMTSLEGQSHV